MPVPDPELVIVSQSVAPEIVHEQAAGAVIETAVLPPNTEKAWPAALSPDALSEVTHPAGGGPPLAGIE